jgi:hypothetical protein
MAELLSHRDAQSLPAKYSRQQGFRRDIQRIRYVDELGDVDATLARFDLRNSGAMPPKSQREILLGHIGIPTGCRKDGHYGAMPFAS